MHAPRGVRAFLAWTLTATTVTTLALVQAPQAEAATVATTYTVTTSSAVRASGSANSVSLATITAGNHVLAAGAAKSGWLPIQFNTGTAYLAASAVKKDAKPAVTRVTGPAGIKTSIMEVPIRVKAKVTSTALKVAPKGTVLKVTGTVSDIYTQVVVDGAKRWASTRRLTAVTAVIPATVASYTTTDQLALRTQPSVGSTNQGTIKTGSTVLGSGVHSGSYSQIVFGQKVGWVITGYLNAVAGTDAQYVLPLRVSTLYVTGTTPLLATPTANADVVGTAATGITLRGTLAAGKSNLSGYTAVIWNGTTAWISSKKVTVSLGSTSLDKLEPNGKAAVLEVRVEFPQITTMYGWRAADAYSSDHPKGRAVDFMIPKYKTNKALGDSVAQYFIDNIDRLNVTYIIWRQRIWTKERGAWKKMADRGSDTQNHMNHVHVSFLPS